VSPRCVEGQLAECLQNCKAGSDGRRTDSAQNLVRHNGDAVHVRGICELGLTAHNLRRRVCQSKLEPDLGCGGLRRDFAEAKIRQIDLIIFVEKNVPRLNVAVSHTVRVQVRHRLAEFAK
jgi:hypothetical protein